MRAKISFIVILISLFAISESSFGQQWEPIGTTNNIHNINIGNVGIGTNNPLQLLHINGANPVIRISDTQQTVNWDIQNKQSSLKFRFNNGNGASTVFSINKNGRLKSNFYKGDNRRIVFTNSNGVFRNVVKGEEGQYLQIGNKGNFKWTTIDELWYLNNDGHTILKNEDSNVGIGTTNAEKQFHIYKNYDVKNKFATIRLETKSKAWSDLMGVQNRIWDIETKENGLFLGANSKENPNSSDFMYVFGRSGNFGIGTEIPTEALHVKKESPVIRLEKSGDAFSAWDIDFSDPFALNLKYGKEGPTENLFTFTDRGRLGIGTDAPEQELHVVGDMVVGGGNEQSDGGSEYIKFEGKYSEWFVALENKDNGTNQPGFYIGKSGNKDFFYIGDNKKVGIGTFNPSERLEVNGNVKAKKFIGEFGEFVSSQWEDVENGIFYSSNVGIGTETPYQPVHIKTETPTIRLEKSTGEYSAWDINFDNSSSLSFKYGNAGPTENLFTFTDRGRFGIGTNAPEQELHVVGDMVVGGGNEQSDGGSEYIKFEGKYSDWFVALENKDNGTNQPGFYISKSGNKDFFYIGDNKNVGIGTTNPSARLTVKGKILAEEIEVVENVPSSDYVFEDNYLLLNLKELEEYIKEKKHLPEVSSAKEFKENGYNMNDFDDLLLRKIEELTLYIIEQNKRIEVLEAKNHK